MAGSSTRTPVSRRDVSTVEIPDSVVTPVIRRSRRTKETAQRAVNGKIEPFPGYGTVDFGPDFDWAYEKPQLVTSFQLYLHNLRIVAELVNEFSASGDSAYLDTATEIVESWRSYVDGGGEVPMTWYDHTTASRARTLVHYLSACQTAGLSIDEEAYIELLNRHADVLMNDENHKMNNHGLMGDHALIMLGLLLGEESFVINGIGRARAIFWQTFSHRGVHQENSPEYHKMVSKMFRDLEAYLAANGRTLGADIMANFSAIDRYPRILAKPDGKLPAIGDSTSASSVKGDPLWGSFHDDLSGTSIVKHEDTQFYLVFISGYSSITHKHRDDLSIQVMSRNRDFFVDSGKYNYGTSAFRRYVTSPRAHSTFALDRRYEIPRDNKLSRMLATDHFMSTKLYSFVSGYNSGYEGAILRRSVYYLPSTDTLLVFDEGRSKNDTETWIQRLNLAPEVHVTQNDTPTFTLVNSGVTGHLTWFGDTAPQVIRGKISGKWPYAFVSPASHKAVPTNQVVSKTTCGVQFSSHFAVNFGQSRDMSITEMDDRYRVTIDEHRFDLPRVDFESAL